MSKTICIVSLKFSVTFTPVWSSLSITVVNTFNPVFVVVVAIKSFTVSTVVVDYSLAGPADMRKQAMFNRIILGGIGGIMRNPYFNANLVTKILQILFKQVRARAVTTTTITQQ